MECETDGCALRVLADAIGVSVVAVEAHARQQQREVAARSVGGRRGTQSGATAERGLIERARARARARARERERKKGKE